MSDIVLVDTSVFCEILAVPGKCGRLTKDEAKGIVAEGLSARAQFLLPWATVLETGNHVGQVADGYQRREAARRFVESVGHSLDGKAPWAPAAPLDEARLRSLLPGFPEWASHGSGLGDLSIVDEWRRQCRLSTHRRVWIWSLDTHLSSYDRRP